MRFFILFFLSLILFMNAKGQRTEAINQDIILYSQGSTIELVDLGDNQPNNNVVHDYVYFVSNASGGAALIQEEEFFFNPDGNTPGVIYDFAITVDPTAANVLNSSVSYTFNEVVLVKLFGGNGIDASAIYGTFEVVIADLYWINGAALDNVCSNELIDLNGHVNLAGGVFTGPGISGSMFNPALVGQGTFNITYSYAFDNGIYQTQRTITVNTVDLDFDLPTTACLNANAIDLSALVSPSGGTFSGLGVSGSSFNPANAGVGSNSITYNYELNNCTNTVSKNIEVLAVADASAGDDEEICSDADPFPLSGSPAGGTWSGTGVSGNFFYPNNANIGPNILTYTISASGCESTDFKTITVTKSPDVNAGDDKVVCISDESFQLTGMSPSGGTWSGTGITGSTFNPKAAGAGTHVLTYTVSNGDCESNDEKIIIVNDAPNVNAGSDNTLCLNNGIFALTGQTPAGGVWTGTGVGGNNFDPQVAGLGSHTLTYAYNDNNECSGNDTRTILVVADSEVDAGEDLNICFNDGVFTLTGESPSGGTWSGTGVSGNQFDPGVSGTGIFNVTYSFVNTNGCSGEDTRKIIVYQSPIVEAGPDITTCLDGGNINLLAEASPIGGIFNGVGVSNNSFNPINAGIGSFLITYTFTNSVGCSESDTRIITVNEPANVEAGGDLSICFGQNPVDLTIGVSPQGGSFSGPGVSGSTSNPISAGIGEHVITYLVSTAEGCTGLDQRTIIVFKNPEVNAGSNLSLCLNAGPVDLSASATPSGGNFSGSGVSGVSFDPKLTGPGEHIITYSLEDDNGCNASDTRTIIVNDISFVEAGESITACSNQSSVPLNGIPTGGIWSGPGVFAGNFNPSLTGSGVFTLIYQVFGTNGCKVSDSLQINVVDPLPSPIVTGDDFACEGGKVRLEASVTGESQSTKFLWYFPGDNEAFEEGKVMDLGIDQTISVLVEAVNEVGCVSSQRTKHEIVSGKIEGDIFASKTVINSGDFVQFSSDIINGNDFYWDFGDGTYSKEVNPGHYYYGGGIYTVSLTVTTSEGCEKKMIKPNFIQVTAEEFGIVVGLENENRLIRDVIAFPQPFQDELKLALNRKWLNKDLEVTLYRLTGEILFNRRYNLNEIDEGSLPINHEELKIGSGIYLLKVKSGSNLFFQKVNKI